MADSSTVQLCTFVVGSRTYAVDVLEVREINPKLTMTPVPHAPSVVRGLVNVRGQVFLILDLNRVLHGVDASVASSSRLVLFKESVGPAFGVLVDAVGDIISIAQDAVLEMSAENDDPALLETVDDLSSGVVKLSDKLVVSLAPKRLLALLRT